MGTWETKIDGKWVQIKFTQDSWRAKVSDNPDMEEALVHSWLTEVAALARDRSAYLEVFVPSYE